MAQVFQDGFLGFSGGQQLLQGSLKRLQAGPAVFFLGQLSINLLKLGIEGGEIGFGPAAANLRLFAIALPGIQSEHTAQDLLALGRALLGEGQIGRHYAIGLRQPALLAAIGAALREGIPGQAPYEVIGP